MLRSRAQAVAAAGVIDGALRRRHVAS
jgi:hypothetical protein